MLDTAGFYKRVCEAMGTDSPVEIARKLGMTRHAAYAWSKGGMPGKSRLGMVARLSMLTGTSIHYLLTGEGSLLGALVPGLSPELAREITLRAGKSGQEVTSVIEELIMTGMAAEKLWADMAEIKLQRSSPRRQPQGTQAQGTQALGTQARRTQTQGAQAPGTQEQGAQARGKQARGKQARKKAAGPHSK